MSHAAGAALYHAANRMAPRIRDLAFERNPGPRALTPPGSRRGSVTTATSAAVAATATPTSA
jgi:hypothetical protein